MPYETLYKIVTSVDISQKIYNNATSFFAKKNIHEDSKIKTALSNETSEYVEIFEKSIQSLIALDSKKLTELEKFFQQTKDICQKWRKNNKTLTSKATLKVTNIDYDDRFFSNLSALISQSVSKTLTDIQEHKKNSSKVKNKSDECIINNQKIYELFMHNFSKVLRHLDKNSSYKYTTQESGVLPNIYNQTSKSITFLFAWIYNGVNYADKSVEQHFKDSKQLSYKKMNNSLNYNILELSPNSAGIIASFAKDIILDLEPFEDDFIQINKPKITKNELLDMELSTNKMGF